MKDSKSVPVLICGGGPVGLALAAELGWRGIDCLLVEQGDGVITAPKMNMVNARTMEICRRWGIAQDVRNAGWPADYPMTVVFATALTGFEIARYDRPSVAESLEFPYGPEAKQRCPQIWFDPLLQAHAANFPAVSLAYRHRLESFEQDASGVTATVRDMEADETFAVSAPYLAACDGAASGIRQALGIGFTGARTLNHNVNIYFDAPGLLDAHELGRATIYWLYDETGHWGNITAVDGRDRWRLGVLSKSRVEPADIDASALIRKAIGRDFPHRVIEVFPWTRRQAVAERYRSDRVFLVGDSAHSLSPTGGFGMNTGIGDAVDLGWKLAGVLNGWGGPALLDSYEIERRPIAERNVAEATRNLRQLSAPPIGPAIAAADPDGEAQRAAMRDFIYANDLDREYETPGIQLGYRYDPSPIVVPDGTPAPPDEVMTYTQTARPGSRAPHAWLADGRSTLDLFGSGFVLLRFPGGGPGDALLEAADEAGVPIEAVDIDDAAIAATYGRRLVLVRPDGHVAWRGDDASDARSVIARISGHEVRETQDA